MDIRNLKGVGEKTAALFEKLHVDTTEKLVSYYPRDYEQFSLPAALDGAPDGEIAAVAGQLSGNVATRHVRGLSITTFEAACEGGRLHMTYFNMPYLKNSLKRGQTYIFRGCLHRRKDRYVMEQARIYKPEEYGRLTDCMQPRYATTKGLTNNAITKAVRQAIGLVDLSEDPLPEKIRVAEGFPAFREAVEQMHFPSSREALLAARSRLVFDEFFRFILTLRRMRESNERMKSVRPMIEVAQTERLIEALPYRLTKAQQKVWGEIQADLTSEYAMNRLVQGDVGSGKTILAFLSLIMCAANGFQGAMMAPTEVLARQHYESLTKLNREYGLQIHPVLLTGSVGAKDRREIYARIESGEADIVIGTHALIQEKVAYKNLSLVITDEQHRFGVRQRETLAEKGGISQGAGGAGPDAENGSSREGQAVHVLVMSATPIPRTLAVIIYGDLDISVVDELPADRLPIKNCVVDTSYRTKAYAFIRNEVEKGRQAYVICPMVEESESIEAENVIAYTRQLCESLPDTITVEYLHGKMKPALKNEIMERFLKNEIQVLVSTTVVEVGVNVPNATVMMVENAERFGLAQLHQLRGRVGRGKEQSYCIMVHSSDSKKTKQRLEILNQSNDGFFIAGEDLKLRGPGDLFGIRQSGLMEFRLGDVFQDSAILQWASEAAGRLLETDEELLLPEHQLLKKKLSIYIHGGTERLNL